MRTSDKDDTEDHQVEDMEQYHLDRREVPTVEVTVELEDYSTSARSVKDRYPDYLTVQSLLEQVASKNSVGIPPQWRHRYALYLPPPSKSWNKKRQSPLPNNKMLKELENFEVPLFAQDVPDRCSGQVVDEEIP